MYSPRVEIGPTGEFVFRNLPPVYVEVLLGLPRILAEEGRTIEECLFPTSYTQDAEKEAEWERFGRPELRALFVSRTAIIGQDLDDLVMEPAHHGFRLEIPTAHRTAWMAGLNAARLVLGVQHGIDAGDMEDDLDFDEPSEKQIALLKIHLLGHLQGLIVEAEE